MAKKNFSTDRRLRHPKKFEQLFGILSQSDKAVSNSRAVFNSKAEIILFAAGVGFKEGKRTSFTETVKDPIRFTTFKSLKFFYMAFNTFAITETKDINILKEDKLNERITIFEEYACTGLEVINDLVINQPGKPLDNIIDMIQKQYNDGSDISSEDILKDFDLSSLSL